MTYEEILNGMLDRVPSNVDKREGSIIYDALAPCAYFLAQQYFQLANFLDLVFPDTAQSEYLDRAIEAYGVARKPATAAVRKLTASAPVAIGSRWGIGGLAYVVTSAADGENVYEAACETVGEIGNQYSGDLQPLSDSSGVTAVLGDIATPGTDEETDEALRSRFFQKVRLPATSGNAYHYKQWALEVPGVGDAKVFPLDSGPGTVTVLVVDEDKVISESLPEVVKSYIESVRPVGATVTVSSPEALAVNVSANILLDGSVEIGKVRTEYEGALTSFFKDAVFLAERISYAKMGSLLLDVPGVEDFDGFQINSGTANLLVGDKQIPVLGIVTLTEVSILAIH